MSICRNRNPNEDETKNNSDYPKSNISVASLAQGSLRRTKKNKTRMPKDIVFNEEEEKILDQYRKKNSILGFDEHSDDDDNNKTTENQNKKEKIVEIINTDLPIKEETKNDNIKDENKNQKEEKEIKNINNEENKEININNDEDVKMEKDEKISDDNVEKDIKEEHVEKEENEIKENIEQKEILNEKENNKDEKNEKNKVEDLKIEEEHIEKEEKIQSNKEENYMENKEEEKKDEKENIEEEKVNDEKKEEESIKKEGIKEIEEGSDKKGVLDSIKDKIKIKVENNKAEESNIIEKENSKEENNDKKEEELKDKIQFKSNDNENFSQPEDIKLRNKPYKIEIKDNKLEEEKQKEEEKKKDVEEKQKEEEEKQKEEEEKQKDEEEEEEDDEEEAKNTQEKDETQKVPKDSNIKDLSKYESLSKIININLEVKGFNSSDVQKELDELFNTFSEEISPDELKNKLSENLIKLMDVSVDSDKIELNNFIKDLVDFNEGDTTKIYEQIIKYIEGIVDQDNLTTRKMNRYIRSCIQECKNALNNRLKEDDIPSDKVINYEKFLKIVEETGIKMKETHMDVLLYQMKKAVPKGRNFNTLNAIVIVDFLK